MCVCEELLAVSVTYPCSVVTVAGGANPISLHDVLSKPLSPDSTCSSSSSSPSSFSSHPSPPVPLPGSGSLRMVSLLEDPDLASSSSSSSSCDSSSEEDPELRVPGFAVARKEKRQAVRGRAKRGSRKILLREVHTEEDATRRLTEVSVCRCRCRCLSLSLPLPLPLCVCLYICMSVCVSVPVSFCVAVIDYLEKRC